MKLYSNRQINKISFILAVLIFFFISIYIPKLYTTINSYIYYKSQPNITQEYE